MALNTVLHRLHSRALQSAPNPVITDLSGGLRITLQLSEGRTYISVARRGVHPSMREFYTVLRYYPNAKPQAPSPSVLPSVQPDGFLHIMASWENSDAIELDKLPTQLSLSL